MPLAALRPRWKPLACQSPSPRPFSPHPTCQIVAVAAAQQGSVANDQRVPPQPPPFPGHNCMRAPPTAVHPSGGGVGESAAQERGGEGAKGLVSMLARLRAGIAVGRATVGKRREQLLSPISCPAHDRSCVEFTSPPAHGPPLTAPLGHSCRCDLPSPSVPLLHLVPVPSAKGGQYPRGVHAHPVRAGTPRSPLLEVRPGAAQPVSPVRSTGAVK